MEHIVKIYEDEPRVSSFDIATGFNRKHGNILRLVEKHTNELKKFGSLSETKIKTKGRPIECVMLNEGQALYIGTTLRESNKSGDKVTIFKAALIKEFLRMKKALLQIESRNKNPEHIEAREHGKEVRRLSTDAMNDFIEYAKKQGSNNAERYIVNFTKMENSLLFIVRGKYKNLRDVMSNEQLMVIGVADKIVRDVITKGMENNVYYKDIYKQAKEKVSMYAEAAGQSNILDLIEE